MQAEGKGFGDSVAKDMEALKFAIAESGGVLSSRLGFCLPVTSCIEQSICTFKKSWVKAGITPPPHLTYADLAPQIHRSAFQVTRPKIDVLPDL